MLSAPDRAFTQPCKRHNLKISFADNIQNSELCILNLKLRFDIRKYEFLTCVFKLLNRLFGGQPTFGVILTKVLELGQCEASSIKAYRLCINFLSLTTALSESPRITFKSGMKCTCIYRIYHSRLQNPEYKLLQLET